MKTFAITGYPRSRTAWLANFFTVGKSFCLHDGLADCESVAQLREKFLHLNFNGHDPVGNSDSMMGLFLDDLVPLFPEAKWVLVRRNPQEAKRAFLKAFTAEPAIPGHPPDPNGTDELFHRLTIELGGLWSRLPSSNLLTVDFEDLDQFSTLARIWDFLELPGQLSVERWNLLHPLRITQIPSKCDVDLERTAKLLTHVKNHQPVLAASCAD